MKYMLLFSGTEEAIPARRALLEERIAGASSS